MVEVSHRLAAFGSSNSLWVQRDQPSLPSETSQTSLAADSSKEGGNGTPSLGEDSQQQAEAKLATDLHSMVSGFEKKLGSMMHELLCQVWKQREECHALLVENGRLRELLGAAASRQRVTISTNADSAHTEASRPRLSVSTMADSGLTEASRQRVSVWTTAESAHSEASRRRVTLSSNMDSAGAEAPRQRVSLTSSMVSASSEAPRQQVILSSNTHGVSAEAETGDSHHESVPPNIVVKLYEDSAAPASPELTPPRSPRSCISNSSVKEHEGAPAGQRDPAPGPTLLGDPATIPVKAKKVATFRTSKASEPELASSPDIEVCDGQVTFHEYELLPCWLELASVSRTGTSRSRTSRWSHRERPTLQRYTTTWTTKRLENMLIQNPVSYGRMCWETIGTIFAVYDLMVMPMQVFEQLGPMLDGSPLRFFSIVQVVYWTLDVPASFFVGYYVDGVLETRLAMMMTHYLRTWFAPDVLMIACDWAIVHLENQSDNSDADSASFRHIKVARALRLLRNLRLLRLLKLQSFQRKLKEYIRSEYILTIMHISKLVVFIVVVNHFVACFWYYIGSSTRPQRWTAMFHSTDTISYRYATSLHWSLTQFTPASMEVHPMNTQERVFNVFVLIFALVTFSSFISSITEAMNHLRRINGRMNSQRSALRRYIGENKVSPELSMRVWKYLGQSKQARPRRLMSSDVELFTELPPMLQAEMHFEVFARALFWHPFFHHYGERAPVAMQAVCHKSVTEVAFISGQGLFTTGQLADRFFFVFEGTLSYSLDVSRIQGVQSFADLPSPVNSGQWLSEAALWIRWYHTGAAAAVTVAMLLQIDAAKIHAIMREYVDSVWSCRRYAVSFAAHASGEGRQHLMSDLCDDFDAIQALAQLAFDDEDSETPGSMDATASGRLGAPEAPPAASGSGFLNLTLRRFSTSSATSSNKAALGAMTRRWSLGSILSGA